MKIIFNKRNIIDQFGCVKCVPLYLFRLMVTYIFRPRPSEGTNGEAAAEREFW